MSKKASSDKDSVAVLQENVSAVLLLQNPRGRLELNPHSELPKLLLKSPFLFGCSADKHDQPFTLAVAGREESVLALGFSAATNSATGAAGGGMIA